MITEIPTSAEFSEAGLNHLHLAWEIVIGSVRTYKESMAEDWDDGEASEEYWSISQPELGNAFALIQQALEFALKGRISEVSPYLLLARDVREWPRKCDKRNVSFSEFRTVDAADLVRISNSVSRNRFSEDFTLFFNEIRRQRNVIVHHGVGTPPVDAYALFIAILKTYEYLWGENSWPEARSGHLSGIDILYGSDLTMDNLLYEFELLIDILKPKDSKHFLDFNKRARSYLCPHCIKHTEGSMIPLAQLQPNARNSTILFCIICRGKTHIRRAKCPKHDCQSNVICAEPNHEEVCLICWE